MTYPQWLLDLPEDIRERAKVNFDKADKKYYPGESLVSGFQWATTPEGTEFWDYVDDGDYADARALLLSDFETWLKQSRPKVYAELYEQFKKEVK